VFQSPHMHRTRERHLFVILHSVRLEFGPYKNRCGPIALNLRSKSKSKYGPATRTFSQVCSLQSCQLPLPRCRLLFCMCSHLSCLSPHDVSANPAVLYERLVVNIPVTVPIITLRRGKDARGAHEYSSLGHRRSQRLFCLSRK